MAPPSWAYQVDAFDPAPDEELVCSVCHCVFCDPVHSPCNHVFCRNCISKWLEMNHNCPICRKRTSLYSLQEVVPLIRNMINKLTLRCHNSERGCTDKFTLESCEPHIKQCLYEMIKCKNRPCKQMVLRKDMSTHELRDCFHRYRRCEKCELKISLLVSEDHDCLKELKALVRGKIQSIKKKNKRIKELESEIKTLKETNPQYSTTSVSSTEEATRDVLGVNFDDEFDLSSGSSISTTSLDSNLDQDSVSSWWTSAANSFQEAFFGERYHLPTNDVDGDISGSEDFRDVSAENPRTSSPRILDTPAADRVLPDYNPSVAVTLDVLSDPGSSPVRRPAKRRLPAALLDSSDEDDEVRELPSLPSPKRVWHSRRGDGETAQQGTYRYLPSDSSAGPSSRTFDGAGPSSSQTQNFADSEESPRRFRLRPRFRRDRQLDSTLDPVPEAPVESVPPSGLFLERTMALLSDYNLESDPEWIPGEEPAEVDSPDITPLDIIDVSRESSGSSDSDSSSSDSDSESGSDEPDLISRIRGIYSTTDDDDPDFIPDDDF